MRQVSDRQRGVTLAGCVFGVYGQAGDAVQPVLFLLEGRHLLPVFTTPAKMTEAYGWAGVVDPYTVKRIDDGREFLASVEGKYPVILDPWVTPQGNTRFLLVSLPKEGGAACD
jgi:hypothetical protein